MPGAPLKKLATNQIRKSGISTEKRGKVLPSREYGCAEGSSCRRSRTPLGDRYRRKESVALSTAQVENILSAARFADWIGRPLNRLITLAWAHGEVDDPFKGTARFFKLASDAMRKRGIDWAWVWVHENGPVMGVHVHILAHVPVDHERWFHRRCHGWAKACGMIRKAGGRHSRRIGFLHRCPSPVEQESYRLNLDRILEYVLKDACPVARVRFGITRVGDHGVIEGKRAGFSQNLGPKARSGAPQMPFNRRLGPCPPTNRVRTSVSTRLLPPRCHKMAMLPDEIKAHIVTLLAQFCGASEITKVIEAEHSVRVDRFQVRTYDPTKLAFAAGEKWRSLFDGVRAEYLTQLEAIPIAHKGYRLNQLQRNYDRASQAGNLVLANAILEQAAKEVGGALTNNQNIRVQSEIEQMSWEERRAALRELIRRAIAKSASVEAAHKS